MSTSQILEILSLLELAGVSRFNVDIHDTGKVIFHSQGMSRMEIENARWLLEAYLFSIQDSLLT